MSALQAFEIMHAFLSDFSAKEFSDNKEYEVVNAAEAVAEHKADSFDSNDEETVAVHSSTFGNEEI